jgi:hypothetical protein
MATKAELIEYGQAHGVAVDDSMLKTDIEQALRDAGHDPNTLTELTSEDPPTGDPQMSDEPQTQSPPPEEPTDPGPGIPPAEETEEPTAGDIVFPYGEGEEQWDPEQTTEVGWFGVRPMFHQDEEYALTSGPDAPTGTWGPE